MVTREQIREYMGHKPFRPFRVTLDSGETFEVAQLGQAVAMPQELVVALPTDDHFRWVRLDEIRRVEVVGVDERPCQG